MNTPTALNICNLALAKLGESPISELSANGNPATRQCYLHYHPTRREILCAHRWSFAAKLIELQSAEQSSPHSLLAHTLPLDCLRVLSVNQKHWELRGRSVYTRDSTIKLLYTYDCEDVEFFEPLFIDALATRLAYKMCISLTSSSTLKESLAQEYSRVALPNASHFNAVQSQSNDSHPLYKLWKRANSDCDDC